MVVDEAAKRNAWRIWILGQTEPEYEKMLTRIRELETEYEDAIALLPQKQENAIRDYVSQCEIMNWRMLQIACSLMCFSDDGNA